MLEYCHEPVVLEDEGPDSRQQETGPVAEASEPRAPGNLHAPRLPGVSVGVVLQQEGDGRHLVEFAVDGVPLCAPASILNAASPVTIGQSVVLAFEDGDPRKPIILGSLAAPSPSSTTVESLGSPMSVEASADGRKVALTAEEEIVLRCGKASITLTRAGKVIIRGEYLVSRSTGVNSIKGGVVRIN